MILPAAHSPGRRTRGPLRLASAALAIVVACIAATWASCDSDAGCKPGAVCDCSEGTECFLGCGAGGDDDGCSQSCHNLGIRCGGVCNNNCSFSCHDMPDCSSSCGDGCNIACTSVNGCDVLCGAGCLFTCTNSQTCGVRAGQGSVITCTSVSNCTVQCTGDCKVRCENTQNCSVTCAGGAKPTTCPDGSQACGPC